MRGQGSGRGFLRGGRGSPLQLDGDTDAGIRTVGHAPKGQSAVYPVHRLEWGQGEVTLTQALRITAKVNLKKGRFCSAKKREDKVLLCGWTRALSNQGIFKTFVQANVSTVDSL